jgi:hypothetical protein
MTAGDAFTPELEQRVEEAIHEALVVSDRRAVARGTMFAARPVRGCWRHNDQLQLMPAPLEAPRPHTLMGDHPFIVDFAYSESSVFMLRNHRIQARSHELRLLLNLLLSGGVTMPTNRGRHHWVFTPLDYPEPRVIWTNEGYFIPEFTFVVPEMPDPTDTPPLIEIDARAYYDIGRIGADELTIPSELGVLIDAHSSLSGDDLSRFDRALYWLAMASEVWSLSQSLHLSSLVNAIECLAVGEDDRNRADGPTASFKQFMREYAPGQPSGKLLDHIYELRSDITHGEQLLAYDRPSSGIHLDQTTSQHRQAGDDASRLTRGALLNWLWSRAPATSELLVTQGVDTSKPAKPGTKSSAQFFAAGNLWRGADSS